MWSDNETSIDLLGFAVHKDLIRHVITDKALMPVTVGVFGDWGGGKSSILRMLERDLLQEEDIACLYFNGWTFEGYDDAKAALISSILIQLGEHKRFGPKLRDKVVPLLKRVNYMRLVPALIKRAAPAIGAAATVASAHIAGVDPHLAITAAPGVAATIHKAFNSGDEAKKDTKGDAEQVDWQELLDKDPSMPGPLDLRTLRADFARLLDETKLKALVVLIDDLDRCSPDRLIENLEAIKLFLAVPQTAFVIAADERIIRHAISRRYEVPHLRDEQSAAQEPYDLVTDYLEKLIQVPYHLPRLSPSEIESYMTLLFCQLALKEEGQFEQVHRYCTEQRAKNLYLAVDAGVVQAALKSNLPDELHQRLRWTSAITPALTEGVKGNPRQVKRLLNALLLRRQLAEVAKLDIRDDVLVKLMLLEYTRPELFDQLYIWQALAEGHPAQLRQLEETAQAANNPDSSVGQQQTLSIPGMKAGWQEKPVQDWLRLAPPLAEVDLRDYFWVARDRLHTTLSDVTMVPPYVRLLFNQLITANMGERRLAVQNVQNLDRADYAALLRLLSQRLRHQPQDTGAIDGFRALLDADLPDSLTTFVEALADVQIRSVPPEIPTILDTYRKTHPEADTIIMDLLARWAKEPGTRGGRAAQSLLDGNQKRGGHR